MAIGFIIFWIVLGLGVFLVAMGRGPRGARGALHTESPFTRRAVVLGVTALIAFGIAIPTLVLAFNASHKASVAPGGLTLTAQQQHGRYLFGQACATCHTLAAARSAGSVGPNLDVLRPPEALILNAIVMGRARGRGQMPANLYQGRDAQAVASFVAATAGH